MSRVHVLKMGLNRRQTLCWVLDKPLTFKVAVLPAKLPAKVTKLMMGGATYGTWTDPAPKLFPDPTLLPTCSRPGVVLPRAGAQEDSKQNRNPCPEAVEKPPRASTESESSSPPHKAGGPRRQPCGAPTPVALPRRPVQARYRGPRSRSPRPGTSHPGLRRPRRNHAQPRGWGSRPREGGSP